MPDPSDFLQQQLTALKHETDEQMRVALAQDAGVLATTEGFDELSEMLREAEDDYDVDEALKAWPIDVEIHMTYERWSHEAAEAGEYDDHGFYEPGGWFYSIRDEAFQQREEEIGREAAFEEMTPEPGRFKRLDETFDYVTDRGALYDTGGYFFSGGKVKDDTGSLTLRTLDTDVDYETGEWIHYTYHVEGPPVSLMRLYLQLDREKMVLR